MAVQAAGVLKIAPSTMTALEGQAAQQAFARFVQWWGRAGLPPGDGDWLRRLWDHAGAEAAELGVDADDEDRRSLYAAAFALMGDMDGHQFLRVADILFLDEPRPDRLRRIAAVAQGQR